MFSTLDRTSAASKQHNTKYNSQQTKQEPLRHAYILSYSIIYITVQLLGDIMFHVNDPFLPVLVEDITFDF